MDDTEGYFSFYRILMNFIVCQRFMQGLFTACRKNCLTRVNIYTPNFVSP